MAAQIFSAILTSTADIRADRRSSSAFRMPRMVPIKVNSDLRDDQVLFLSDILPTGWMAAENASIEGGDTVAVWGCGPVGQMTIKSAWLLGAGRVIAIDRVPERLRMAETAGRAETIDFSREDVYDRLMEMTGAAALIHASTRSGPRLTAPAVSMPCSTK